MADTVALVGHLIEVLATVVRPVPYIKIEDTAHLGGQGRGRSPGPGDGSPDLDSHHRDGQGGEAFDRRQFDLRLDRGDGEGNREQTEVELKFHATPHAPAEVVVLQGDLEPAKEHEGSQGDVELHLSVDTELAVGTEVSVYLDGDEIEEVDGKLMDGDLKNPVLIGQAHVTLALEEQDTHFRCDAHLEAGGGDTQVFCGRAGVDLEYETSLDVDQRNGDGLQFQFQIDDEGRFLGDDGATLDPGATEGAKLHEGVELEFESLVVDLQVEGALDHKHVGNIELAAPFHNQGARFDGALDEVVGDVPGLGIDLEPVDGLRGASRVERQTEVPVKGEVVRTKAPGQFQLQASHNAFIVDVKKAACCDHTQRLQLGTGRNRNGDALRCADLEIELAVQLQDAAKEAQGAGTLDNDIEAGFALCTRDAGRPCRDAYTVISHLLFELIRHFEDVFRARGIHEELECTVEFQHVTQGNIPRKLHADPHVAVRFEDQKTQGFEGQDSGTGRSEEQFHVREYIQRAVLG